MSDGEEQVVPAVGTLENRKAELVMDQFGINGVFASELIEIQ